jgi:glycosyltransferase involved in cell wall biosynthesis
MTQQRKKKIAMLLPSLAFGGGERVSLSLAEALADLGIEVEFVLTVKEGELLAEAEKRFRVVDLRCGRAWQIPFKLMGYVARSRPDAIISNYWKINVCACAARLLMPLFKLVVIEHSPPSKTAIFDTRTYALTSSAFYRAADTIVAVSSGVAEDIMSCTLGLSRRIVVIYNAIKGDGFGGERRREEQRGRRRVITVGRLSPEKNHALLLEAFRILATEVDAELVIVGEGELRPALQQRAAELGLTERVSFAGFQPRPADFLAKSDLFVLSSDQEGLPTALIEALYCGLPVVSTDCPHGPREILMDGKYGSLVRVGDACALAEAMATELAGGKSNSEQQRLAAERFAPAAIARRYLAVLGLQ